MSCADSFIGQVRLAQVQDPPATALILLEDETELTDPGPICVDSAPPLSGTLIDPSAGGLRLQLWLYFDDVTDKVVLRAVGLHLMLDPLSPLRVAFDAIADLQDHTHDYLTGKGGRHRLRIQSFICSSDPGFVIGEAGSTGSLHRYGSRPKRKGAPR